MTILDEIIANTAKEVEERKKAVSIADLEKAPLFDRRLLSLADFIRREDKSGIIAEIKKQSPSKGVINDKVSVTEVGEGYEASGASAISVLTDFKYFGGRSEYLTQVREKVGIPILRKDFMIDEYQLYEARAIGADIILLIAAALEPDHLFALAKKAKDLGLSVLMEVHDEEELNRSLCDDLDVVGVNNRNLKTFDVSIETSLRLADLIPIDFVKISESGLKDAATIHELKDAGYEGFLIGETFMKTENPAQALKQFIEEIETYKVGQGD